MYSMCTVCAAVRILYIPPSVFVSCGCMSAHVSPFLGGEAVCVRGVVYGYGRWGGQQVNIVERSGVMEDAGTPGTPRRACQLSTL